MAKELTEAERDLRATVIVMAATRGLDGMTRKMIETLKLCSEALEESGVYAMMKAKRTLTPEQREGMDSGVGGPILKLMEIATDFVDAAKECDAYAKAERAEARYKTLCEQMENPHRRLELRVHSCDDPDCDLTELLARWDAEHPVVK